MRKIFTLLLSFLIASSATSAFADTQLLYHNGASGSSSSGSLIGASNGWSISNIKDKGLDAGKEITLPDKTQKKSIKVSAGVDYTVTIPEDKVATSVTIYSYVNADKASGTKYHWIVDGTEYDDIQLNAFKNDYAKPDINKYTLSGEKNSFIINPVGKQVCIVLLVEYTDKPDDPENLLENPIIKANYETGHVTLEAPNALKIHYTIDGSTPKEDLSEESTTLVYTNEGFDVEDGTTVKALAIGDGQTWLTSGVSSETIWLINQDVATPVIHQMNGTCGITCNTLNSSIFYSINNGEYKPYTGSFTVQEKTTVSAYAERENWTKSPITEQVTIDILPEVTSTKTILIGFGSFSNKDSQEVTSAEENYHILKGIANNPDQAYGTNLVLCHNDKKWYSGGSKIKMTLHNKEVTGIKLSNGAANKIELPEGMRANRITIYSYQGSDIVDGWREVNGVDYRRDIVNITSTSKDATNPDVRIYNLDGVTGSFTFTNSGNSSAACYFVYALDIEEAEAPDMSKIELYTYNKDIEDFERVDLTEDGINLGAEKAGNGDVSKNIYVRIKGKEDHHLIYACFEDDGKTPDYKETAPEDQALRISRSEGGDENDNNILKHQGDDYTLVPENGYELYKTGTLKVFAYDPQTELRSPVQEIAVNGTGSGTSEIVNIVVDNNNAPVEFFNLQGVRVDNPANGIFIRRQGNNVEKVVIR